MTKTQSNPYTYFKDEANTQIAFVWYYWYRFLKNLLFGSKPRLLKKPKPTKATLIHGEQIQRTWCDFFGLKYEDCLNPFVRFNKFSSFILFDKMEHFHLSFKNLVHVKTEAKFFDHNFMFAAQNVLTLTYELFDIIPLEKNRVGLIIRVVASQQEKALYETKSIFVVKKVPQKFLETISKQHGYTEEKQFNNLRQIKPLLNPHQPEVKSLTFYIEKDLGKRYGLLSGDLNPLHSSDFFSRLIGGKKSFVQGLCTLNYILSQLTTHEKKQIMQLDILFCQFVYTDQTLQFHYTNDSFELVDEQENLLVKGSYRVSNNADID